MVNKYSFQKYDGKTMVRAIGKMLPISRKKTREVLKYIHGKKVEQALTLLEQTAQKKRPIPFKRYRKKVGHKRGKMTSGRYPVTVSEEIIQLLKLLKANAEDRGIDEKNLKIIHAAVQKGPKMWHYGRHRSRLRKICHVELVAKEEGDKK